MPTASPSMRASMGVVEVISANAVVTNSPAIVTPTPMIAMTSGMPAAAREPSVKSSTMKAMSTPIASVAVKPGIDTENTSPP